jgi:hypothetical protein
MTAKQSNMSLDQAREMYDKVANGIASQKLLRLARDGERESILENQRVLIKSNLALGMLPEQAEAAAHSLTELAGAKVMTKIQTGVNMRSLFSAMGMGAQGAIFQKELLKLHPDTNKLRDSVVGLQKVMDEKVTAGGTQQQMYQQSLTKNLKVDDVLGEYGEKFGITAGKTLAVPQDKLDKSFSEFRNSMMANIAQSTQMTKNNAEAVTNGTLALATATKSMEGFLSQQSHLVADYKSLLEHGVNKTDNMYSSVDNFFTNLGPKLTTSMDSIGKDAVTMAMGPLNAFGATFYTIGFGLSKILSKLADWIGLTSISANWEDAANRLGETATGYLAQMHSQSTQASTKQTELIKTSIPKEQPVPQQTVDVEKEKFAKDAQIQVADYSKQILESSQKQTTSFTDQLTKLDESTKYLKLIADNSVTLISLAEKQLVAATMTAEERTKYAGALKRSDVAFSTEFATIR